MPFHALGSALVPPSACSARLPLTASDLLYGLLSFFQRSPLKPIFRLGVSLISLDTGESPTFHVPIQLNVYFGHSVFHSVSHYLMYESLSPARRCVSLLYQSKVLVVLEHCAEKDSEAIFEFNRRMLNADFIKAETLADFYVLVSLAPGSV